MAKKDPFDFSKAKGSIPFRTPMTGGVSRNVLRYANQWKKANEWGNVDSKGRIVVEAGVSPFKALAMYFSKIARAGIGGADELAALNNVAKRSATTARRIGAVERQAGLGLKEANSMADDALSGNPMGYSSKLFPDAVRPLFRPGEIDAIYKSFMKLQGRSAANIMGNSQKLLLQGESGEDIARAINNGIMSGRVIKSVISRQYMLRKK